MSQFPMPTARAPSNVVMTIPRPVVPGQYDQLATILEKGMAVATGAVNLSTARLRADLDKFRAQANLQLEYQRVETAKQNTISAEVRVKQQTQQMLNEETAEKMEKLGREERLGLTALRQESPEVFDRIIQTYTYLDPRNQDRIERARGSELGTEDWVPILTEIDKRISAGMTPEEMSTVATEVVNDRIIERQTQLTPLAREAYEATITAQAQGYVHNQATSKADEIEKRRRAALEGKTMAWSELYFQNNPSVGVSEWGDQIVEEIVTLYGNNATPGIIDDIWARRIAHGMMSAEKDPNTTPEQIRDRVDALLKQAPRPDEVRNRLAPAYSELKRAEAQRESESYTREVKDFRHDMNLSANELAYTDLLEMRTDIGKLRDMSVATTQRAAFDTEIENLENELEGTIGAMETKFPVMTRMRRNGVEITLREMRDLQVALGERPDFDLVYSIVREFPEATWKDAMGVMRGTKYEVAGMMMMRMSDAEAQQLATWLKSPQVQENWEGIVGGQAAAYQGTPLSAGVTDEGELKETNVPVLNDGVLVTGMEKRWADLYAYEMARGVAQGMDTATSDKAALAAAGNQMIRENAAPYIVTGHGQKAKVLMPRKWLPENPNAPFSGNIQAWSDFTRSARDNGYSIEFQRTFHYMGKTYIPMVDDGEVVSFYEIDPKFAWEFGEKPERGVAREELTAGTWPRSIDRADTPNFFKRLEGHFVDGLESRANLRRHDGLRYREERYPSTYVDEIDSTIYAGKEQGVTLRTRIRDAHAVEFEKKIGEPLDVFLAIDDFETRTKPEFQIRWRRYRRDLEAFTRGLGYGGMAAPAGRSAA